ncbi:hypothetical protein M441DRAFT_74832 [Trichoderma asperellum CBS 433.97]|uniref:WSC domain-containing protein n=1 Tax=Trichoderma asperellum (strain ATCC 204424 / CBS 433.97 / NBRC 101777) TaxID=1042311 RepID=A0A2T3YQB1_TRIA4|nr:hypothetical protein M441DRAFT_74832 [Trichoderma asperellum CBS 433.97]PTB34755.1 hypothetical protein M441DRAFT_74832 [Trichoderma asperellum CBS 433.97]
MRPISASTHRSGGVLPVYSFDPKTVKSCIDWWNNGDETTSCKHVRDMFGITPEDVDCEPWRFPLSYCVSTSDRNPPPGASTTTTRASSTTSSSTSSHVPSPSFWTARGCYPDDDPNFPVLEHIVSNKGGDSALDIAGCENSCWKASVNNTVLYAGVKAVNQCWCSSFIGGESASDQGKCNRPCSGNKNQICGGDKYINVFEPVTTKATSSASSATTSFSKTTTRTSSSATGTVTNSGANRLPISAASKTCSYRIRHKFKISN